MPLEPLQPLGGDASGGTIGHGLLCVRVAGDAAAGCPSLCVTHLTADGERARQAEVGAALRAWAARRAVLAGTLVRLPTHLCTPSLCVLQPLP